MLGALSTNSGYENPVRRVMLGLCLRLRVGFYVLRYILVAKWTQGLK